MTHAEYEGAKDGTEVMLILGTAVGPVGRVKLEEVDELPGRLLVELVLVVALVVLVVVVRFEISNALMIKLS